MKARSHCKVVVVGALAVSFLPCAAGNENETLFRERLAPLLDRHCASCHGGDSPQSGFQVSGLDHLLQGGKRGPAVIPGDSGNSPLVQYLRGQKSPKMPLGGELPQAAVVEIAAAIDALKPAAQSARKDPHAEWLFGKPKPSPVPAVKDAAWVANPIDAFVLARLEQKGLSPAPPAGRRALLRRLSFDLIGLPPTPGELEQFEADTSPDAVEKVIDRLLADSRYGERWGRHWLDLVRFAESDGFAIDGERPTAWRYRDYVIRAFRNDKPYDQFIQEQLAGDEIARPRGAIPAEPSDALLALGFLRMGPWEADANFDNQLRQDFLNEVTAVSSQVFLGLTVGCARCHDHKYDPISQRDHYRMQAFFAATRIDDRPAAFVPAEDPIKMRTLVRRFEDDLTTEAERLKDMEGRLRQKYLEAKSLKPGDKGADDFQRVLNDRKDPLYSEEERKAYTETRDRIRVLTEQLARHQPLAYAVSEVVPPHVLEIAPTHVLLGGQLNAKGEPVQPGFLQCISGSEEAAKIRFVGRYRSGRRSTLAQWIASPDNPLTARVMANRIWQHHFGEGIVRTPSDFGLNGDRPTHPELLDWLAAQFVEKKWSIKAMHKLMLASNTYRQSTAHPDWKRYADLDPDNRLLWRMNWLRLEGEALRDSILSISGRLRPEQGGPGVFFDISSDLAQGFSFFKWHPSSDEEKRRRSIYQFQRRSVANPMMEVFDGANMSESCARRSVTTVPPQAFTLWNGQLTHTEAAHFADRVIELAGPDADRQIDRAFQLALNRSATDEEKGRARALYTERPPKEALTRLGIVLFNLNEFIYLE